MPHIWYNPLTRQFSKYCCCSKMLSDTREGSSAPDMDPGVRDVEDVEEIRADVTDKYVIFTYPSCISHS